jgi:hypothetical protein
MAFATEAVAEVTIGLVDASGSRSTVRAHLASTTDETAALASGVTLAGLVAALTDCQVETVSVTYKSIDTAAAVAVFPGASIEEKGRFIFVAANGKFSRLEVPAIKDAVVDQSGAIPTSDTDVTALLNELETGGWVSATGSDLVTHHAAYKAYRRSTRNMLPTSKLVS